MALEVVRRTNLEQARKWRERANVGRQNQRVEVDQLVWIKKDYTTSLSERKLGVKWVGPYKVKGTFYLRYFEKMFFFFIRYSNPNIKDL